MASGATCVQRLDGSRDSAIHTKYRISLRSSSMQEPRYPLPRVILDSSVATPPERAPFPGRWGVPDSYDFLGAFRAGGLLLRPDGTARGASVPAWGTAEMPCGVGCPRGKNKFAGRTGLRGIDNDPSAGSPTETLLRLLLPLNDKVQWTSHNVAGSEPPTSPRSEHFTGPFNR